VSGAGFAQWAVAENGTVVYVPGQARDLVRVSRDGSARLLLRDRERYHSPRVSPEGRSVLVDVVRTDGRDVWIAGLGGEDMRRVTFNRDGHDPVWAADSHSFYYLAGDAGRIDIFRTQLGSASPAQALKVPVDVGYTGTPLLGGGFLTTVAGSRGRGSDVVRFGHRAQGVDTLLASAADESFPVPSPDGRWYAYTSDHSGRTEVYLRSLGGSDIQLQVSADGATEPVWSRDGREIFYRRPTASGAELMAAALELGPVPRVVTRTRLFDVTEYDSGTPHAGFDVTPDGRSFVFVRRNGGDHIVVLQNVAELARRAARGTGALP
jgi:Tol biopolymer transport system component